MHIYLDIDFTVPDIQESILLDSSILEDNSGEGEHFQNSKTMEIIHIMLILSNDAVNNKVPSAESPCTNKTSRVGRMLVVNIGDQQWGMLTGVLGLCENIKDMQQVYCDWS